MPRPTVVADRAETDRQRLHRRLFAARKLSLAVDDHGDRRLCVRCRLSHFLIVVESALR